MEVDKKYYYIRLKENFFDYDTMQILESMPDGYLYSNILLKLYLKSLKHNGKLMFSGRTPYSAQVLATITRHQVETVEKALEIFINIGLAEVLDNGAIHMPDIQNYIKLRNEMRRKDITVYRLAKMSKIASQDLYNALNGKKAMFPNWKKRIAEALETDVESLFEEENAEV